jgi:hypothetical protein
LGPHPSIDGQVLRLDLSRGGWLGRCRYPREAAVEKKATRELQGGPPLCKCWCVCVRDLFLPLFHPPWGAVAYWCGWEETSLGGVWLAWMPRGGPASTGSRVSARRGYQVLGSAPTSFPSTSVGLAGSRDCAPPPPPGSWVSARRGSQVLGSAPASLPSPTTGPSGFRGCTRPPLPESSAHPSPLCPPPCAHTPPWIPPASVPLLLPASPRLPPILPLLAPASTACSPWPPLSP